MKSQVTKTNRQPKRPKLSAENRDPPMNAKHAFVGAKAPTPTTALSQEAIATRDPATAMKPSKVTRMRSQAPRSQDLRSLMQVDALDTRPLPPSLTAGCFSDDRGVTFLRKLWREEVTLHAGVRFVLWHNHISQNLGPVIQMRFVSQAWIFFQMAEPHPEYHLRKLGPQSHHPA